jgi:Mn2+/Fe2+ NRAMP family transporter
MAKRQETKTAAAPLKPVGLLKSLGPGLVTGAADDDPSGIATYS